MREKNWDDAEVAVEKIEKVLPEDERDRTGQICFIKRFFCLRGGGDHLAIEFPRYFRKVGLLMYLQLEMRAHCGTQRFWRPGIGAAG